MCDQEDLHATRARHKSELEGLQHALEGQEQEVGQLHSDLSRSHEQCSDLQNEKQRHEAEADACRRQSGRDTAYYKHKVQEYEQHIEDQQV